MAGPEAKINQFNIKKLDGPHEADDIVINHSRRQTEIVCIKRNEDGSIVRRTTVPSLHLKNKMAEELDRLFIDMLSADEVIIRNRVNPSFSPRGLQRPSEGQRPVSQ